MAEIKATKLDVDGHTVTMSLDLEWEPIPGVKSGTYAELRIPMASVSAAKALRSSLRRGKVFAIEQGETYFVPRDTAAEEEGPGPDTGSGTDGEGAGVGDSQDGTEGVPAEAEGRG